MKTESVIDFPKDTLCPDVWEKVVAADGMGEVWQLKHDVKDKVLKIWKHVCPNAKVVHITGSITSNSYAENADIDVHFLDANVTFNDNIQLEQFQKEVRDRYQKTYIGKHPIEVYYQDNKFQDYMSVGCYDVLNDRWLVGPELTDQTFNPYSEYYAEVHAKSEALAQQIRNMIFSIYEIAVVLKKNIGTEFQQNVRQILATRLEEARKLYDSIRQSRKVYSSPTSAEEALRWRSSRKWKIADASFKLFDKYGYTAILKQFIQDAELMSSTNDVDVEVVEDILSTVKNYISNADKLAEKELYEDEQVNEGVVSKVLLAALLAIPGILPAKEAQKTIDKNQGYEMTMKDLNQNARMIGNYTALQAANIIARTLYAEARNDGKTGMTAVASVIYNRANGKASDFANVCKKHGYSKKAKRVVHQFSCWNKMTDEEWSQKNFKIKIPKTVKNSAKARALWETAKKIAADMLSGSFTPTTDANMYYAPKKCSPDWAKELTGTVMIGRHKFGKLKNHSAFV